MIDHFAFSSAGRDPDEAFREYAHLYSNGVDVLRGAEPFAAEVRAWRFDGMILFDRRLTGVTHARMERAESDGFDHLVVQVVLSGELIGSPESGFDRIRQNEIVLMDAQRPVRISPRDIHMLTVSIARRLVEPSFVNPAALHGHVLRPPATLLLIDFLVALTRHADEAKSDPALTRAVVDLLQAALHPGIARRIDQRRQEQLRREAVDRFVVANLGRRDLSVDDIAAQTGISRSALYRLLDKQGGVARFIQDRRLAALRVELDRGNPTRLADLAEQLGFASEAHMRRLFIAAFGVSPSAYREEMSAARGNQARTGYRKWQCWMRELA